MGASFSQNTAESIANVSSNLLNSTNVSVSAKNKCLQSVNMDGCLIKALGDVVIEADCTQANKVAQYGTVASTSQMSNDVAQDMSQQAMSDVTGFGFGISAAANHAITSASITNNVTNATKISMDISNASEGSISCKDSTIDSGGNVYFSATADQSNDGTQVGQVDNYTTIANTVEQTVDQSATATVSGINLTMVVIIVVAIIVAIVISAVAKAKSKRSIKGGAPSASAVGVSAMCMVVAVCFLIIGVTSISMAAPCNYNAQCQSKNWWETSWGCSCTDRSSCGLNVPYKTPVPVMGAPLMFLCSMDDSTGGQLYSSNLRKRLVRSTAGFSGRETMNNSGYNVGVYLQLRATAASSPRVKAMVEFVQRKIAAADSKEAAQSNVVVFPTTSTDAFQKPCTNLLLDSMLPLVPYYLSAAHLPPSSSSCSYHQTYAPPASSSSSSSSANLLRLAAADRRTRRRKNARVSLTRLSKRAPKQTRLKQTRLKQTRLKRAMPKRVRTAKKAEKKAEKKAVRKAVRKAEKKAVKKVSLANEQPIFGAVNMGMDLCFKATTNADGTPGSVVFKASGDKTCPNGYTRMWKGSGQRTTAKVGDVGRLKQRVFGAQSLGNPEDRCTIPADMYGWAQYNNSDMHTVNLNSVCDKKNGTSDCVPGVSCETDKLRAQCERGNPNNSFGMILGVVAPGGTTKTMTNATQMCQDITSDTGNVFGAAFSGKGTDFSFDINRKYDGVTALNVEGVGSRAGDEFCAHALGLQFDGTQLSASRGQYTATSNWDTSSSASSAAKTASVTVNDTVTGQPVIFEGSSATYKVNANQAPQFIAGKINNISDDTSLPVIYDVSNPSTNLGINSFPTGSNTGFPIGSSAVHPIGFCYVPNSSKTIDYLCNSNNPQNCYTPWLCRNAQGYWSNDGVDKTTGGAIACSSLEECYAGGAQCNRDPPCSVNNCSKCSTGSSTDGAGGSECEQAGCAVNPLDTSQCTVGCNPDEGICMTCGYEDCKNPCGWSGVACAYGSTQCDPDSPSDNYNCPDLFPTDDARNLVEIPNAFVASTSVPNETNCLPNIFVPTPSSLVSFNNSGGAVASENVRACSSDSTSGTVGNVARFDVNCVSTVGNCYNDSSTCPDSAGNASRFFKTMQIQGSAACFFGNRVVTADASAPDAFKYSAVPQSDYEVWASYQVTDDNRGLWYMCNRVFAWTLMYANDLMSNLSLLGLSTLMNSAGMNKDTKQPAVKLETVDDLARQLTFNGVWSRIQPLMFEVPEQIGDAEPTYFYATLEDIVNARAGDYMIGSVMWKDEYLSQINQFVYSTAGDTEWQNPNTIAQSGIGGNIADNATTEQSLKVMQAYAGTIVGSTGTCQTIFTNDYISYGSIGVASVLAVAVLIYWIVHGVKSARS